MPSAAFEAAAKAAKQLKAKPSDDELLQVSSIASETLFRSTIVSLCHANTSAVVQPGRWMNVHVARLGRQAASYTTSKRIFKGSKRRQF
jgi:hypothetical protein